MTVTETLKRNAEKQGKGADAVFVQAGSWRNTFTIKLPLTPGATMEDIGEEDVLSITIGDYSFEGVFGDAAINQSKREAVFTLLPEDEFTPTGTVTLKWTPDAVTIIGKVAAEDPDATTVYPLDSADEHGKINDVTSAAVEISGNPDSDEPRAFKEWEAIKVHGNEQFREITKRDETFLKGSHSITGTADNVRPTIKVESAKKDVRLENGLDEIVFAGTARDDKELVGVLVRVDGEDPEDATFEASENLKKGEWSFETGPLEAGPHRFEFQAIDHDGLLSLPTVRTATVVKLATLTVTQKGSGTLTLHHIRPAGGSEELVSNFASGSPLTLEAGATYRLEAVPAPGDWVFGSWSGDVEAAEVAGASFTFVLPDIGDVNLAALFVTNPYPALAGSYALQFGAGDDAVSLDSIGNLEFNVTPGQGSVSGKIFLGGSTGAIPFAGQLSASGVLRLLVAARPHLNLAVEITVDPADPADPAVSGTVVGYDADPEDPVFETDATGFRSFWKPGGATVRDELVGNYTLLLETADLADDRGIALPRGYATAKVSKPGTVTLTGALPNGAPFTFGGELSQAGDVLVRLPVDGGVVTGVISIAAGTPKPTVEAVLYWNFEEKDAASGETEFSQVSLEATGERFVPPAVGESLFLGSNGIGAIDITTYILDEDRALTAESIVRELTLSAANIASVEGEPSPDAVTVTFNLLDGRVSGSFIHPGTGHPVTFNGVVLQDGLQAAGFYKDGTDVAPFEINF